MSRPRNDHGGCSGFDVVVAFLALGIVLLGFLMLLTSGCTIGGEPPDVPTAPAPGPMLPADPILPRHATPVLSPLFISLPPSTTREPVVQPEPHARPAKPSRRGTEPSPTQVIQEANTAARIPPTPRCYFGGGGVCRYVYVPGRIYDVFLSPASATRITFPVGEILAHEVILPADAFDLSAVTIGTEVSRSTVLFIRPCGREEPGCKPVSSVDVALVSETGRSFDLHLIVGTVSMVGVAWSVSPIPSIQLEEAPPMPGAQR